VRSDDSTRKTVSSIETDTVTASGTVDLNLASVGSERLGRVLCGDTALEGETTCGDVVLSQTKLLERRTSGDLNLSSNDIDTSDLLSDGVLDLDTGVNFNEIVSTVGQYETCQIFRGNSPILLVDQELSSTGIAVLD
jgi:hypothetical protein